MVETFDPLTENGIIIYIKITVQEEEKKDLSAMYHAHSNYEGFFKRKKK